MRYMSLARSGVKKSPVTMRSQRPPCRPGICASNWILTQLISSPSRLAISFPSSIRMPWRLPFSSMYWTGGRVALVATTSLPGRTTTGGVTAGEAGYFAACAWAKAGIAIVPRARRPKTTCRPRLRIWLPPVGLGRGCRWIQPAGQRRRGRARRLPLSTTNRAERRPSATAQGGDGRFEGDGFLGAELARAEATALVGRGEPGQSGRHRGRLLFYAARELTRRFSRGSAKAATGEQAEGLDVEARHGGRGRPTSCPR